MKKIFHSSGLQCLAILFWIVALAPAGIVQGQDDDPVDFARKYPPELLKDQNVALKQLEWQMTLLERQRDQFAQMRQELTDRVMRLDNEIMATSESLPVELRFLDSTTRSQLAGKLMGQLLDLRFESAGRERMIEALEARPPTETEVSQNQLKQAVLKMEVQQAELRYAEAAKRVQQSQALADKQYISKSELTEAEFARENAALEVRNAEQRMELAQQEMNAERARDVAQQRLEILPLKARAKVASEMMEQMAEAAPLFNRLESLRRERDMANASRSAKSGDLDRIDRQLTEIRALRELLEAAGKESKSN